MGGLFGGGQKKKKGDPPPHPALVDAQLRDSFGQNRVYTALDASLGIRKRKNERTTR